MSEQETVKTQPTKPRVESEPSLQPHCLRGYLQQEFLERLKRNPQYSLRSYAQFLGLNSGTLSQIFKGQRKMGPRMFKKLVHRLGLSPELAQKLDPSKAHSSDQYSQLSVDSFHVISDWYHFAILELIKTEDFQADAKWMAKRLSLTVTEVHLALERLERLQYIKKDDSRGYQVCENNLSTLSHDFTNAAFKKLQMQILTKAIEAVETIPLEQRLQTSLSIALNRDDLPKLKEMIHRFRREVNAFLESHESKQDVYHFSVSLYPVTKPSGGEES